MMLALWQLTEVNARNFLPVVVDLMQPVLFSFGQYLHLSGLLHGNFLMCGILVVGGFWGYWRFLEVLGGYKQFLVVLGGCWWFLVVVGGSL